jgi:nitrite reductase (NADH) small subunit
MTSGLRRKAAHDSPSADWVAVCRYSQLLPERGVAAIVAGLQIALFRTFDGRVYAVDNQDPFTGVFVLSRGLVGDRQGVPTVASPLHKQVFDLVTGTCLDDVSVTLTTYGVRVTGDHVEVLLA